MWALHKRIKELQHSNADLRTALYEILDTFTDQNLKDVEAINKVVKIAQQVLNDTQGTSY